MKTKPILQCASVASVLFLIGSAPSHSQGIRTIALSPSPQMAKRLGQQFMATKRCSQLTHMGDALAKAGDWHGAAVYYQEALKVVKDDRSALYGLAKCSHALGDTVAELQYYRAAIYSSNPADKGFWEKNATKLMQFALLLNHAGQSEEAISVYNHAAAHLNYQESKQVLKVLLPQFADNPTEPNQLTYTSERLQAMADVAIAYQAYYFNNRDEALQDVQEAVTLCPDSAVAYYYLGEFLHGTNSTGAADAYKRAADLGDSVIAAAANEALKTCVP